MSKEESLINSLNKGYNVVNIRFGNFLVKDDNCLYEIVKEEDEEKEKYVGEAVWMQGITQNYETHHVEITLGYSYLGQQKEITVTREALQVRELPKLMAKGVGVQKHVVDKISLFLAMQERDAPYNVTHTSLGWDKGNHRLFKSHNLIGDTTRQSTYVGLYDLKPKGTFKAWEEVVKTHVVPYPTLSLALTFGFTASIASLISKEVDIETLIIHIFGESSTGKTTAVKLAVSPFGKPSDGQDGLVQSWNGTQKSIIHKMSGLHGIPIVLDEASMIRIRNFTNFIYQVAMGIEQSRLTTDIVQQDRGEWSGVILSTGESSLIDQSNQKTGIRVRAIEPNNIAWTNSAEHAQSVNKVIMQNYGHAGTLFIEHILTYKMEEIVVKWEKWSDVCYEKMDNTDQFSHRIANKLALVLVTAELMNEVFEFQVDLDEILTILLEVEQATVEDRNIADRAYTVFQQKVYQNRSKFQSKHFSEKSYECYGKITEKSDYLEVAILKDVFATWMKEAEFEDTSVILKGFRDKELLDHDKDKFTRKRAVKQVSTEMDAANEQPTKSTREITYCIKVPKNLLQVTENGTPPPITRKRPRRVKKPTKGNDLFWMDDN